MLKKVFSPDTEKTHELSESKEVRDILMLEDEGELTDILRQHLEARGFRVSCVKNGVEGLKKVMQQDFDVILCDMLMPNLPGDMFYLAVQKVKPQLCSRFIFMTGHRGNKKIDDFIRSVRGLILWKPFQIHEMIELIDCVLKK